MFLEAILTIANGRDHSDLEKQIHFFKIENVAQ
jgi:hypothetical protein